VEEMNETRSEPRTAYLAGFQVCYDLRRAGRKHGAGAAELAAISRMAKGKASCADVELLAPLAEVAGLPWAELYPEVLGATELRPGEAIEVCHGEPGPWVRLVRSNEGINDAYMALWPGDSVLVDWSLPGDGGISVQKAGIGALVAVAARCPGAPSEADLRRWHTLLDAALRGALEAASTQANEAENREVA